MITAGKPAPPSPAAVGPCARNYEAVEEKGAVDVTAARPARLNKIDWYWS